MVMTHQEASRSVSGMCVGDQGGSGPSDVDLCYWIGMEVSGAVW